MNHYRVWCPDLGEGYLSSTNIYAISAMKAAMVYAERSYDIEPFDEISLRISDYPFLGTNFYLMTVRPKVTVTFHVTED